MLRCRFSPPYLCRRGPPNSSLAVYWPQYWPLSLFPLPFVGTPFVWAGFEIDVVSRVTLPAWPGQGYGRHWLFFRALSPICILSVLGRYIVFKVIWILYWISVFLTLWVVVVYICSVGSIVDYCVMILLRFPPARKCLVGTFESFLCGFGGFSLKLA